MKFIGLFSGAGGLDHGFKQSGWQPVILSDYWLPAVNTLKANNPGVDVYDWDVADLDEDTINNALFKAGVSKTEVDAVIGGPPCQAFSRLNQNQLFEDGKETDINKNDPRRSLFMDFLRVVGYIKPKFVVMENVSDISTRKLGGNGQDKHKLIVEVIEEEFNNAGYRMKYSTIKTNEYNVPQKRKRIIFIGVRKDLNIIPTFPAAVKLNTSVKKQFEGIKKTDPNQDYKNHSEEWKNKISHIPQGGYYKDLPIEFKVLKPVTEEYIRTYTGQWRNFCFKNENGRLILFDTVWTKKSKKKVLVIKYGDVLFDMSVFIQQAVNGFDVFRIMPRMGTYLRRIRNDVSHTVTRNPLIHPEENRELTVREKAAIQTFPHNYEFIGSIQEQHILVGNAVPCNAAEIIANHLKALDK